MLNKFLFLLSYNLKKKLKSKTFIIANIVIAILLIGMINIDSIIQVFGGDFNQESYIYIVDKTDYEIAPLVEANYQMVKDAYSLSENVTFEMVETEEIAKEKMKETENILLIFEEDTENYFKASLVTENYIDGMLYQSLIQCLNTTKYQVSLTLSTIDQKELEKINAPLEVERIILDESKKSEEENMEAIMGVVFPTLVLPFFLLVVLLVQMVGNEINEEKQTRSMEIIISNVTPSAHFFSRILSANLFVLLQSFLVFMYGVVGLAIRKLAAPTAISEMTESVTEIVGSISTTSLMDKLPILICLGIILIILSFLAYSLVAGILASMTVSIEDYQHIQTPIVIVLLLGYYLSIMAGMFDGSILVKVLSYVPFLSALLSPALLIIGDIGVIDVVISIVVLGVLDYIMIKYGMRVYKVGVLNYSTDKMWSRIFKAIKNK